jgi:hypothetical protein
MDSGLEQSTAGGAEMSEPLTPELELVAQLLADGQSDAAAALSVGRTAKWVQRARNGGPGFGLRVRELKAQRAAQAAAGLGALLEEAVGALRRGLLAEKTADQLRAAALVFDRYQSFRAESEAAERMRDLQGDLDELRQIVAGLGRLGTTAEREEVS